MHFAIVRRAATQHGATRRDGRRRTQTFVYFAIALGLIIVMETGAGTTWEKSLPFDEVRVARVNNPLLPAAALVLD